jgi:hypothetical protein
VGLPVPGIGPGLGTPGVTGGRGGRTRRPRVFFCMPTAHGFLFIHLNKDP